jgi:hypothetical protein
LFHDAYKGFTSTIWRYGLFGKSEGADERFLEFDDWLHVISDHIVVKVYTGSDVH